MLRSLYDEKKGSSLNVRLYDNLYELSLNVCLYDNRNTAHSDLPAL